MTEQHRAYPSECRDSSGLVDLKTLDSPELAATYDEVSDGQFEHGKQLISELSITNGECVLDVGMGTGRLAAQVAEIVGPSGLVIGIDPLPLRVEIAKTKPGRNFEARVGRAEDLSEFANATFDVVYLNSVFHWIAYKAPAPTEIFRVLKPQGRVGLNCQDASRPHESRLFVREALVEAGVQADYDVLHPSLAVSSHALHNLLVTAGLIPLSVQARTLVDVFADVDAVLAWSSSSSFGNFLVGVSVDDRAAIRDALARKLESKASDQGIRLERYLIFATARKPSNS
ncbi:MAG: methyltransferase domain-containing protein [Xanthobacteraceae bacterium]|nr:methyltransferase domain-containing protein [Xanthobacteraceae bacterium]